MTWKFQERYNSEQEFNPRLIACANCSEYSEPEEMTQIHWASTVDFEDYCKPCVKNSQG